MCIVFYFLMTLAAASCLLPLMLQPAGGYGCGMPIGAGFGAALFLTAIGLSVILFDALMRSIWNRIADVIDDPPSTLPLPCSAIRTDFDD